MTCPRCCVHQLLHVEVLCSFLTVAMSLLIKCVAIAQQLKLEQTAMTTMATKAEQKDFETLLAQMVAEKNLSMNAVTSRYFHAIIAKVGQRRFKVPCPNTIAARIDEIHDRLHDIIARILKQMEFISIEDDSWTSGGMHMTGLTSGAPGQSMFMSAYQNDGPDDAVNSAVAVNKCGFFRSFWHSIIVVVFCSMVACSQHV